MLDTALVAQRWLWPGSCVVTILALAVSDVAYRKVSNTMLACALMLGVSFWTVRAGVDGWLASVTGALVIGGVLLPGYVCGLMGAADVKAGAAMGAMVSSQAMVMLLAATLGATFILSLYMMFIVEGLSVAQMAQRVTQPGDSLVRARAKNTTLPFALCLSVGAAWAAQGGVLWHG